MEDRYPLLKLIHGPADLRSLPDDSLPRLAAEIRRLIIAVVSVTGGHLASNLGVVELSIALHREFSSPADKIVWDVGHQSYTHKILTGRREEFHTLRQRGGLSGFPKRGESPHDIVETGHASTSLSAALGILTGQELLARPGRVIAVIGDGALTGGMAMEALNHAGHLGRNLIIILNDNEMSISRNVGAMSSYLSRLSASRLYRNLRSTIDSTLKNVPRYGSRLADVVNRVKKSARAVLYNETLFSDLGFGYIGPLDGHDIPLMREVFRTLHDTDRPVVAHVFTKKGKGYAHAEDNPTAFHGITAFSIRDGKVEKKGPPGYTDHFARFLRALGESDPKLVAITAAMAKGTGLALFQESFPSRFFDVGITEQHAVTFAAGLAAAGLRPVVAIYSTFMQRAVDQVIHDAALPKLGVTIVMDRAGLVEGDGETHQGLYDIALFRCVPNITFMAPASAAELELMLSHAVCAGGPVLIRFPKAPCANGNTVLGSALETGRGVFLRRGRGNILILSLGALCAGAEAAADILAAGGLGADVYNLRFIKPLDTQYLKSVLSDYRAAYLVEDGSRAGGMGDAVGGLLSRWGLPLAYGHGGAPDEFLPHGSREELLADCGLDAAGIAEAVRALAADKGLAGQTFLRRAT
ncbi:MAG: 1-deoxy-D-xylulose-5-phosphate synthase [Spirochaetales bacterium]|jgi:1-deoxy-D-xylulose-5-phosphate synthase|nr:1-deoxy-D-xylulose-5-phosphate synthase [Spirochaetales bacterium]